MSTVILRKYKVVLATATDEVPYLESDIAGRPIAAHLAGPELSEAIHESLQPEDMGGDFMARAILVCGSIHEVLDYESKFNCIALHGLFDPAVQTSVGAQTFDERAGTAAARGLVGSSVTIPGRVNIVITSSALYVHKYYPGSGEQ